MARGRGERPDCCLALPAAPSSTGQLGGDDPEKRRVGTEQLRIVAGFLREPAAAAADIAAIRAIALGIAQGVAQGERQSRKLDPEALRHLLELATAARMRRAQVER
jgi:hypothetical protein